VVIFASPVETVDETTSSADIYGRRMGSAGLACAMSTCNRYLREPGRRVNKNSHIKFCTIFYEGAGEGHEDQGKVSPASIKVTMEGEENRIGERGRDGKCIQEVEMMFLTVMMLGYAVGFSSAIIFFRALAPRYE